VLGNGSRHRSDLCCTAEFVTAKSPAAGNRQSGLGEPVSKFLIRRIGDELRLDLLII
jgi:hypothetical protein